MTVETRVALIAGLGDEFPVSTALLLLGLPRSTWYYQAKRTSYDEKHAELHRPLMTIARMHPEYGYRRATTELQETYRRSVNGKVVQRLQRLWELSLVRSTQVPRPSGVRRVIEEAGGRANLAASLESITPFEVVYTDFTELIYARGRAHLIPIVDHASKAVIGWALGNEKGTTLALTAWSAARRWLGRRGIASRGIIVHHDRDPIFTGYGWTGQLLLRDRARVSYALRGAKDNPEMESFNSRFKNENRSLFESARTFDDLMQVVGKRISYYNRERRHSVLCNQAPMVYLKGWRKKR